MRVGFGIWCVGLCLLLAGAAAARSWTACNPDGGRYRIDMPGAPYPERIAHAGTEGQPDTRRFFESFALIKH